MFLALRAETALRVNSVCLMKIFDETSKDVNFYIIFDVMYKREDRKL